MQKRTAKKIQAERIKTRNFTPPILHSARESTLRN